MGYDGQAMVSHTFTIATRESRLALWQAEHVKSLLEGMGHQVSLLGMTTRGDQILDRSLSKVGGKGLFVKELEVAGRRRGRSGGAFPERCAHGVA
jgi:hydroxymethylbilane synthase